MNNIKDNFASISPYSDEEVEGIIESLIEDKIFHQVISYHIYPSLLSLFPSLSSIFFKRQFKKIFGKCKSIKDFQENLAPYVGQMIKKTTDGFTYSGIENLNTKPTLYISNHRDIALDSLFLNFALYLEGMPTVRIAIGDNLLDSSFFEKIMRLNKSFVVHRNIKGAKETLRKLSNLSRYINHSLVNDRESIWIAQLEGRANDGNDFTDPAVLKMLYLSERKDLEIDSWVKQVNLTPVSISYEYDPLDITKATGWEGWENLSYEENNKRDLSELVTGIKESKGRVHLELAELIDQEIISNYKLWPSTYISAHALGVADTKEKFEDKESLFLNRFKDLDQTTLNKVLRMYASPLENQKKRG